MMKTAHQLKYNWDGEKRNPFGGFAIRTQKETAKLLGMSQARVMQIEHVAIAKLRRAFKRMKTEEAV